MGELGAEWVYDFFWNSWDIQSVHPGPLICKMVKIFRKCFGDFMPGSHIFSLCFSGFFRFVLICGSWKGYWTLVTKASQMPWLRGQWGKVRRVRYRAGCREREKEKITKKFYKHSDLERINSTSGFSLFVAHVFHERILKDSFWVDI